MTVPRSVLSGSSDLQLLSNDLIIPNSFKSSQGTVGAALQQAFVQSVEAKVEARLAVLLEGIGDAFYALDSDWRFTYINRAAQDYFGVQPQDMLGRVIWELFRIRKAPSSGGATKTSPPRQFPRPSKPTRSG